MKKQNAVFNKTKWFVFIVFIVFSCKHDNDPAPEIVDDGTSEEDTTVVVRDAGMYQLVATDAVGRELPTYDEVGDLKEDKYVGLFYWIWHTELSDGHAPYNLTNLLAAYPEMIRSLVRLLY